MMNGEVQEIISVVLSNKRGHESAEDHKKDSADVQAVLDALNSCGFAVVPRSMLISIRRILVGESK